VVVSIDDDDCRLRHLSYDRRWRVVGLFTMLAGIAAASIITSKFAEFLLRSGREDASTEAAQQAVRITRP
jgi:hypothetical protein